MDSAACVMYYRELGREVHALFADYGQAAARNERVAARAIAGHYGIDLYEVTLSSPRGFGAGEVRGRNALLAMVALTMFPAEAGAIASGIHAGTTYYDCTEAFVQTTNSIFHGYTGGRLTYEAPFVRFTKADIHQYCRAKEVPIRATYSCEAGTDVPCGQCLSCLDRRELDAREE
jgi:7-cyano-7-deazaguanine synthase